MHFYLIVLRILHIGFGVFWTGTALFMVFYIIPAVIRSGPEGAKIMKAIASTNKFAEVLIFVSATTVITGFLLLWQLSAGFSPIFFTTPYGGSLGLGGVTAFIAFLQVLLINRPSMLRIESIGNAIAGRSGVPSEEEKNQMLGYRNKVFFSTRLIAFWLSVSIVTMAGARYF